jgi:hypothetical protein
MDESQNFLGGLFRKVGRFVRRAAPVIRRVARAAVRAVPTIVRRTVASLRTLFGGKQER